MRILISIVALFSVQALACPDLTGSYTCTYSNGQSESMTISQRDQNGVTYYKYNTDEFPADGSVIPMADSDVLKNGTFKAWCESATLKNQIQGKYYNQGSEFGDLDMIVDITKAGANLQQVVTGNLVAKSGDKYPINETMTCTAN